jgi:hypothetical protein
MANKITEEIGADIAGSLIATTLLRVLVEKGVLTGNDARNVIDRAVTPVKNSHHTEEQAAYQALLRIRQTLPA